MESATALRKRGHHIEERPGCSPWCGFLLDRPKFRHHLVVHRDLDAHACVSLDPADQRRQPPTGFANREFHHGLRVKIFKMYSHVQERSTSRCLDALSPGLASWMSRRALCKTILGMGMVALTDQLGTLRSGIRSGSSEHNDTVDDLPDDEEAVTHVCGRHLPNGGFTIRSKRRAD